LLILGGVVICELGPVAIPLGKVNSRS
jgi:hypothetical protein